MRHLIALLALLFAQLASAQLSVKKHEWVETPLASVPHGEIVMAVHQNYPGSCAHTVFSVYWNIPTGQEITAEQDARLLQENIIPLMKSKCPKMPIWDLSHFIKGKPLFNDHGDEVAFTGRQNVAYEGRFIQGTTSLRASAPFGSYDNAEREIGRIAKGAQIAKQVHADNRAREAANETQQRDAKCKAETQGGQHPCGLKLAQLYVETANKVVAHCRGLFDHEWCNVDGGRTYVRWVGATKDSCVAHPQEKDTLVCKFTLEWDCRVRDQQTNEAVESPAVKAALCAGFPNGSIRAEARKIPGDWETRYLRPDER